MNDIYLTDTMTWYRTDNGTNFFYEDDVTLLDNFLSAVSELNVGIVHEVFTSPYFFKITFAFNNKDQFDAFRFNLYESGNVKECFKKIMLHSKTHRIGFGMVYARVDRCFKEWDIIRRYANWDKVPTGVKPFDATAGQKRATHHMREMLHIDDFIIFSTFFSRDHQTKLTQIYFNPSDKLSLDLSRLRAEYPEMEVDKLEFNKVNGIGFGKLITFDKFNPLVHTFNDVDEIRFVNDDATLNVADAIKMFSS